MMTKLTEQQQNGHKFICQEVEEQSQMAKSSRREGQNTRKTTTTTSMRTASSAQQSLLFLLLGVLLFVLSIQTINAMPPLQLLRMYSNAPNSNNPALDAIVANSQQRRSHHSAILSRQLRQLSNLILAENGAKIRELQEREFATATAAEPLPEKRANEFELGPTMEEQPQHPKGRDLLLNEAEQQQKEQLNNEQEGEDEEDPEDSAVLKVAAAVGLLRQERNEPNVAAQKLLRLNELGGTMFRFG